MISGYQTQEYINTCMSPVCSIQYSAHKVDKVIRQSGSCDYTELALDIQLKLDELTERVWPDLHGAEIVLSNGEV